MFILQNEGQQIIKLYRKMRITIVENHYQLQSLCQTLYYVHLRLSQVCRIHMQHICKYFLKIEEGWKAAALSGPYCSQTECQSSIFRQTCALYQPISSIFHPSETLHLCVFPFSLSASCVCTVALRRAKTCTWSTTLKF